MFLVGALLHYTVLMSLEIFFSVIKLATLYIDSFVSFDFVLGPAFKIYFCFMILHTHTHTHDRVVSHFIYF